MLCYISENIFIKYNLCYITQYLIFLSSLGLITIDFMCFYLTFLYEWTILTIKQYIKSI